MKKLIALCALSLVASNSAFAQSEEEAEGIIEEVVVTATYRETDLMDTPVSISAVTDKMVKDTGAQDMEGLFTLIPSFSMSTGGGNEGKHRYTVRGVTAQSGYIGSSPTMGTVGIYIDDVPVTSSLGPDSQMNGTLFDIDRVEVLKGPQGTLFGEGSQGGTVRYLYKKPDPGGFDAAVNLSAASMEDSDDNSSRIDGMINLPLGDSAALRLTAWRSETAGFIDNQTPVEPDYNTAESEGVRAAVRFEGETFMATLTYSTSEQRTKGGNSTSAPYTVQTARIPELPPSSLDETDIINLDIKKEFSWGTLQSLTSSMSRDGRSINEANAFGPALADFFYFGAINAGDHEQCAAADVLGAAFGLPGLCGFWPGLLAGQGIPNDGRNIIAQSSRGGFSSELLVQEFRLVSNADERLRWTAGFVYKDNEDSHRLTPVVGYYPGREAARALFDPILTENATLNHDDFLEETAVFGEISYDLSDTLEITAGVRWADIEQSFQRWPENGTNDTPVSPKLVFAWQPRDELLVYGGYTTGFRPGNVNNGIAFNLSSGFVAEPEFARQFLFFDGDEVDNFELGVKTTFWEGRVSLQAAAFFLDWKDMLVHDSNPRVVPQGIYNVNSGGAEVRGAEFEVKAYLTDSLQIRLTGDVNDAEITGAGEFQTSPVGKDLTYSPNHSYSLSFNYGLGLQNGWRLEFYIDRAWVAKQFQDPQNTVVIPSFERSNGRVTLTSADEKWRVALYGTNLEDKQTLRGVNETRTSLIWFDPRQLGIEVGYQL
jgi:iron complex outermembrane recepter protein